MALTAFLYFKSTNVQVLMCLPFTDENREIVVASGRLPTLVGLLKEDKLVQLVLLVVFNICVDSGMYHILLTAFNNDSPLPQDHTLPGLPYVPSDIPFAPHGSHAPERMLPNQPATQGRARGIQSCLPLLDQSGPRREYLASWSG